MLSGIVGNRGEFLRVWDKMNTAYKIIMIVVGCVVAYFLMSLAANSQKMAQGISSQSEDLKSVASITKRIQNIEDQVDSVSEELKATDKRIDNTEVSVEDKISDIENKIKVFNTNKTYLDDGGALSQIDKLSNMIEALKKDNEQIKEELLKKNDEIDSLKSKLEQNAALLEALDCTDSKELNKKIEAFIGGASNMGVGAYKRMQSEIDKLLIKVDGMKEAFVAYKATSADKVRDLKNELKDRANDLKQMLNDSKQYTEKEIKNIEKNFAKLEKSTMQNINISPNIEMTVKQISDKVSLEIENIKLEVGGLQKRIETLIATDENKSDAHVGIIVNKLFEKSLVMVNTAEGTYVFNPYADFTGVIRVRDESGNEKMVLVPYTGEYMKIGENIIDTGPFSRSCALGINCNIDVRGSANALVTN